MQTNTIYSIIKNSLQEIYWQEVICALKQDPIVWKTLHNQEFICKLKESSLYDLEDWLPVNLGFLYLDLPWRTKDFLTSDSPSLDVEDFNISLHLLEEIKEGNEIQDLGEAVLVAVALRERHYLGDSWQSLRISLNNCHPASFRSILVCLFGLESDPIDLLGNLTSGKNQTEHYLGILHILLSNPIGVELQTDLLTKLISSHWNVFSPQNLDHLRAIQYLSLKNPELAVEFGNKLLDHRAQWSSYEESGYIEGNNKFQDFEIQLLNSELVKLTKHQIDSNSINVLDYGKVLDVIVEILISNLTGSSQERELNDHKNDNIYNLPSYLVDNDLIINHPAVLKNNLIHLLENREYDQAMDYVLEHRDTIHSNILRNITLARTSLNDGNIQDTTDFVRKTLDCINEEEYELKEVFWHHHESIIYDFIELLIEIDLFNEANQLINKALSCCPRDKNLHLMMGEISLYQDIPDISLTGFYNALLFDPDNLDTRRKLALCLEKIGNWEEAYQERTHILDMARENDIPPNINDIHALAECEIKLGNQDEAHKLCEQAIDIDPDNGYSHSLIGKISIEAGEFDAALEHLEYGIQLSPDLPKTWLSLVEAQKQANDFTNAIETLFTAAQAIPTSIDIYLALGEIQLSQKALTDALTTFKKGSDIEPNNTQIALKHGMTLHLLGHLDDAKKILDEAHQRKPNHIELAYEYAKVLLELGEIKSSLPLLETVIDSNPYEQDPYLEYVKAALSLKGYLSEPHHSEKIIDALQKATQIDADNPITYALFGEVYAAQNKNLEAKQAYQIAFESDLVEDEEWFARLSLGMGRVALGLGQEDVALASLQEAVQADPNNPLIYRTLSEVYLFVDLLENALQTARAALNLAIEDIDILTWYADQMLLISEKDVSDSSELSSSELLKQVQAEALNALQQAIQIAPERADLIVKLGKLQSSIGDITRAINTLNSLIENEYANSNDLVVAGKMLAVLGDRCGAIALLEHVSNFDIDNSSYQMASLLVDLTRLYQLEGDYETAINKLNQAQEQYSSFAPIYHTRANILMELDSLDDSLACVLEGLEKTPQDEGQIPLYMLAGKIFRIKGDLKAALNHGHKGLSLCEFGLQTSDQTASALKDMIGFISELYRAILKPNRGQVLIKGSENKYKIDLKMEIDQCCTYLELFFETTKDDDLTDHISHMVEQNPNHPRVLALQSRIFNRRGDYQTAIQILHAALDAANQQAWNLNSHHLLSLIPSLFAWYSLCDAALELEQWDTAQYVIHQILDKFPKEPRALINLTKTIISRAEYQRLCEYTGVTSHAPGSSSLSPEARRDYEEAISSAIQNLPSIHIPSSDGDDNSEVNKINPIISRWRARGLAVFGNNEEIEKAVDDLVINSENSNEDIPHLNSDDISALIAAETRLGNLSDDTHIGNLIQIARTYSADAKLQLQTAIALAQTSPSEATIHLGQLNNNFRSLENPYIAIANALYAKLALQLDQLEDAKASIDTAVEIWPNEPHWQILTGEIYQKLGNVSEAVHHIDEAIHIEPNNINNYLKLGKLLIETSDIDMNYPKRAVQVLERACRLKPEEPEAWFYLARAYLISVDIEQAVSCADMAIDLSPRRIEPLVLRSEIALYQEDPISALDYVNQALEIDKNNIQAVLIKSQALRDLGRAEDSLKTLESAMVDLDDPLQLHIEYALLLKDLRGPQASIEALETLIGDYPENPGVLSILAKNMAETGQIEIAIQTAQRALQISNGNLVTREKAELHFLLGKLLIQVRQLDQAIHHLSESITLIPNYVEPYLELGHALQERRQYRQALDAYQTATKIAPNDPRPHFHLGIALKEGKDYQTSETMLRRAADLAPDDVNIRRQLAAVVALNLVHNPRSQRIVEE